MRVGFKDEETEELVNDNFDIYIGMIREFEAGTKEFDFACAMVQEHLNFLKYNRTCDEVNSIRDQCAKSKEIVDKIMKDHFENELLEK